MISRYIAPKAQILSSRVGAYLPTLIVVNQSLVSILPLIGFYKLHLKATNNEGLPSGETLAMKFD